MNERWQRWHLPEIAVALCALAAAGIGILNRFTYDDRYIIELNPAIKTLHAWWQGFGESYWSKTMGGDGYRPLTILAFKLEWALGTGSPMVFHAVNILLYAAASVLVFRLARKVLPLPAAWLAGAFFAVHPVHVEAVANVVGQSELLVACTFLGAVAIYMRDRLEGRLRPRSAAFIVVLYAIGCLSKEHAIVLPAVLLAAEATLIVDTRPWRERLQQLRPVYLALTAVALAFMAARSLVLVGQEVGGFRPYAAFSSLHTSTSDRILTAIGVVPHWVRLLFWPARLSSEYAPPDIEIAQGASISQLPGLMLLLAVLTFGVLLRRRQPVISFGIALTCITLLPVSNFILPAGIVLAERTLFLPSVGAVLILGALAALIAQELRARTVDRVLFTRLARATAAALLIAGATRSALRTPVWRDNDTLFDQAVIDAPLAYRAHYMRGAWSFERKRRREGEEEFRKALSLFPYDPWLAFNLAEQYRKAGLCDPAIPLYRWARGVDPNFPMGRTQLAVCLLEEGQYDEAKKSATEAIRAGGDLKMLRRIIFTADSAKAADAAVAPSKPVAMSTP